MTDEMPGVAAAQAAAREMIRAARSMLDAFEGLVEDPDAVTHLVGSLGRAARDFVGSVDPSARSASGSGDDDDEIEHIPVD